MRFRELITTNAFTGVAAGQTATLDLPAGAGAGLIYHAIRLRYANAVAPGGADQAGIEADIAEIRILIDGVVQRRFKPEHLYPILAENGIPFNTGVIPIFFSEPWRRSVQGEDALAWGVRDVSTFQIEVDIAGTANSPSLTPRLEVERGNRPLGQIIKWHQFTVAPAATGVFNLTTLPKKDSYARLHFFETAAGDISQVEVIRDARTVFRASDEDFEALYTDYGLTPQDGLTSVIFDRTQRVADMLTMRTPLDPDGKRWREVTDFRVDITFAAANPATLITETLGPAD